jgi:hypothetical protein
VRIEQATYDTRVRPRTCVRVRHVCILGHMPPCILGHMFFMSLYATAAALCTPRADGVGACSVWCGHARVLRVYLWLTMPRAYFLGMHRSESTPRCIPGLLMNSHKKEGCPLNELTD